MKNQIMKNLLGKRIVAVAVSGAMILTSLTGCQSSEEAKEEEKQQQREEEEQVLQNAVEEQAGIKAKEESENHTYTVDGNMAKDETVYVLADANGNTNEIIVSDWIKNPKSEAGFSDVTNLENIKNTNGDEIYTEDEDGSMHWVANGNDIHYQGTADASTQLPVDVSVKYYLEGEEVTPEVIAGKQGNVKIRFDYKNNQKTTIDVNGKSEEVNVPFAMISGMILPTENFYNVKVTNGRVITEGKNNIVVGMAFPGLSESLDIKGLKDQVEDSDLIEGDDSEDFEIPEYVEVSAFTTDFEMNQTMTVAVTDILSALDSTTASINTDKITDSIDELTDATSQLSDGSARLSDGASQLNDGARTLSEKSVELNDGAKELSDGAKQLDDSAAELIDGAIKLDDGAQKLKDGAASLKDGTGSLVEGVSSLREGAVALKDGTTQLVAGYEGEEGALYGAWKLNEGASQLNDAVQNAEVPELSDEQKKEIKEKGSEGAKEYADDFAQKIAYGVAYGSDSSEGIPDTLSESIAATFTEEYIKSLADGAQEQAEGTVEEKIQASFDAKAGDPYQLAMLIATGLAVQNNSYTYSYGAVSTPKTAAKDAVVESADSEDDQATDAYEEFLNALGSGEDGAGDEDSEGSEDDDNQDEEGDDGEDEGEADPEPEPEVSISINPAPYLPTAEAYIMSLAKSTGGEVANSTATAVATNVSEGIEDSISSDETKSAINTTLSANLETMLSPFLGELGAGIALSTAEAIMDTVGTTIGETMTTLGEATSALSGGINSLYVGLTQLYEGTNKVDVGMTTLYNGTDKLQDGAYQLDGGACTLANGIIDLKNGTTELKDGTIQFKDGTWKLYDGTVTLADGTTQFVDGTATLYDGTKSLSDGSYELMDGMLKFDEEGVGKIKDMFGSDVDDVVARFKAVVNSGSEYTIFTDSADGVETSVKFIYKTDAVKSVE